MKKIILATMLFMTTGIFASDIVYKVGDYEEKNGILYLAGTNIKINGIVQTYYEFSNSRFESYYKDGVKVADGITKIYSKSGALINETNYKNHKQHGITKIYYESGALQDELDYKNGKRNGVSRGYYESGALKYNMHYKDGEPNGMAKEYYESGILKKEINIKDAKNGIKKTYYESGTLWQEVKIENGKAISGILYTENGSKLRNMTNADFAKLGLKY